ncbi:MAG: hypothetical protein JO170_17685 [Verrucomicrobia bacterium]|nr:hypothetical protein [Verrucomicrobiota bacterium]
MVEVLGIFGFLSWLILVSYEWLSSLQVFPAIVSGTVLIPIFALRDYRWLQRRFHLQGLSGRRSPVPPERFYWEINRRRLQCAMLWSGSVAIAGWSNASWLPASWSLDSDSIVGWMNAGVGIVAASRFLSAGILFIKAAQWFDAMRPNVIGLIRMLMYKLSDNYEFLGQRKADPEREKVY